MKSATLKLVAVLLTFAAAAMNAAAAQVADAQVADAAAGKTLFASRCGMCHQTIGMAVGILARRPGDLSKGLLEDRSDLSAAVVGTVVRTGIANMPRLSRAEVSDPELRQIAVYLAQGRP